MDLDYSPQEREEFLGILLEDTLDGYNACYSRLKDYEHWSPWSLHPVPMHSRGYWSETIDQVHL